MKEGGMEMDKARQIYLANERERAKRKAAREEKKQTESFKDGPATRPVITELMRREAAAHAKFLESTLPPRDRE